MSRVKISLENYGPYALAAANLRRLEAELKQTTGELEAARVQIAERGRNRPPLGNEMVIGAEAIPTPSPELRPLMDRQRTLESAIRQQREVLNQLRGPASKLACQQLGAQYARLMGRTLQAAHALGAAVDQEILFRAQYEQSITLVAPVKCPGVPGELFAGPSTFGGQSHLMGLVGRITAAGYTESDIDAPDVVETTTAGPDPSKIQNTLAGRMKTAVARILK